VPRKIPPNRFDRLIRNATAVFTAQGYRLTQMSGIAEAVGVSKATLYLYVESKDVLLWLCLKHGDSREPIQQPDTLPVPTPPAGRIAEEIAMHIRDTARFHVLPEALKKPRADDIHQELYAVLDELYTLLEANCQVVRMLDRCSDHPELGPLWHDRVRSPARGDMARYIESRMRAGQLRQCEHPRLASRIALETVATWAMHIKWDRAPEPFEPTSTKAAVIEQICHSLLVNNQGAS